MSMDIRHQAEANRDYLLTVHDLEQWENETQVLDRVILLVRTGWGDEELYSGTRMLLNFIFPEYVRKLLNGLLTIPMSTVLLFSEYTMKNFWIIPFWIAIYVVHSAPVKKRMVDLTHVFDNETLHHPVHKKFEINVTHNGTYPGTDLWIQLEEYSSATHAGTHMDAPCHFAKSSWAIDQIPLERFIAPAAVVDIERQAEADSDYLLTIRDLEQWENETGQVLDHVILLVRTGWSKRWGNEELYIGNADKDLTRIHNPGISAEAAQWLVDHRNIYGVGIDAVSFDSGQSMFDFSAHSILLEANIYGLENVANLDQLPLYGAKLYVMPMKIGRASGAPTRIIATYPHIIYTKSAH